MGEGVLFEGNFQIFLRTSVSKINYFLKNVVRSRQSEKKSVEVDTRQYAKFMSNYNII